MASNPWKRAWIAVIAAALGTALALGSYGAFLGYQASQYLATPVGTFDNKPLTRAAYVDLLLAREAAQAKQAAPAPTPEPAK